MTTVTQAEILHGVTLLASAKRRTCLEAAGSELCADLAGRVLPSIKRLRRLTPRSPLAAAGRRPITQLDALIAAMARSRDAGVATPNVADFDRCGIGVIGHWRR